MRNNEVASAGKQSIDIPFHVRTVEGIGIVLVTADTKAFVAVASLSSMTSAVRGALAHSAVTASDVGGFSGGDIAPNNVLAGNTEMR